MYFFTSEKHVIETFRELAIFIEIHNFSYLKRNDILKFQQFQTFKNWLSVSNSRSIRTMFVITLGSHLKRNLVRSIQTIIIIIIIMNNELFKRI